MSGCVHRSLLETNALVGIQAYARRLTRSCSFRSCSTSRHLSNAHISGRVCFMMARWWIFGMRKSFGCSSNQRQAGSCSSAWDMWPLELQSIWSCRCSVACPGAGLLQKSGDLPLPSARRLRGPLLRSARAAPAGSLPRPAAKPLAWKVPARRGLGLSLKTSRCHVT